MTYPRRVVSRGMGEMYTSNSTAVLLAQNDLDNRKGSTEMRHVQGSEIGDTKHESPNGRIPDSRISISGSSNRPLRPSY